MDKLLARLEPEIATAFKKETRRGLHKIQTQADIEHEQMLNRTKNNTENTEQASDFELIAG